MKLSLFDFDLPESCIATHPVTPRDASRLLVVRPDALEDRTVRDLCSLLRPGDVMVFNDTRVIPARLYGRRGEAAIEILLHRPLDDHSRWRAFARPAKRLKVGDKIVFSDALQAQLLEKFASGEVALAFNCGGDAFWHALEYCGHMPLPPYIARADAPEDRERYQTVYAQRSGAVAAPTAGLHFTPELLAAIDAMGVTRVHVTLHVGAGTFQPVKVEDTDDHVMHREWAQILPEAAEAINRAKAQGGRVIAVGTTSLRVLESAAREDSAVQPFEGETGIFITPGYRFKAVDVLMTNFHLPKSTLFMLVAAFSGLERMRGAYAHAMAGGYRFYSYGDSSWLLPCSSS